MTVRAHSSVARRVFVLMLGATVVACSTPPSPAVVRVGTLGTMEELPMFVIQERGLERAHGLHLLTAP